jgi:thiamine-monophosphate kinase
MGISEQEVIDALLSIFPQSHPDLVLGIGDDAAIFNGTAGQVVTTDIAVEGNHFKREWSNARAIGARVVAANVADLLAMNARPQFLLLSVTLTGSESIDWVRELAQGVADEAAKSGAVVIGGDTAKGAVLTISITAIGQSEHPITRVGAKVGDDIFLSSLTGWSAAGLHLFQNNISLNSPLAEYAISQYQSPTIDYGMNFSGATALADVSDALIIQGAQIAAASHVAFEINCDLVEQSPDYAKLNELALACGVNVLDWIVTGGEDHALLATGHDLPGLRIGSVVAGSGIHFTHNGAEIKIAPVAWSHF